MEKLFLAIFVVSRMGWNLLIDQKIRETKNRIKNPKKGAGGK